MPIIRRSNCVPLPRVVCPVVAVVMLESRVTICVHCVENVALPINHYLLHLVGFSFTYLSKMHGHSNIKFAIRINFNGWNVLL